MAYERAKTAANSTGIVRADSLDAFVKGLSDTLKVQMQVRNAAQETTFNEEVLAGNISLAQQLSFRQAQLKAISDDPAERARVRGEIASLKDRIEQQDFTDKWAKQLGDFQGGIISIDSVIDFLKQTQASTTDQSILNTVSQKLADMQAQKFQLTQDLIKSSTTYAVNSKTSTVIDDQIAKVQKYRNDAKLAGEDTLVAQYDLQIQTLNQAKNDAQVQQDVLQLGAATATGAYGAVALLDSLNQKINSASSTGPVTVAGTTYATAKDFWMTKRNSFLSDSGSNGFFSQIQSDVKDSLDAKASKNILTTSDLQAVSQKFDSLLGRSDLKNYASEVNIYKQKALQDGANTLMISIENEFTRTLDVNKAVTKLNTIKNLGVNVDKAYTEILNSNAATKSNQVQGILSYAHQLMVANPSLSSEQATQQAIKDGAGSVFSPTDLATKTEGALAASKGTGKNDVRTTAGALPGTAPAAGATTTETAPTAGIYVIGNTYNGKPAPANQVWVNKNGTVLLRPTSNPTPELSASTPAIEPTVPVTTPSSGVSVIGNVYNGKKAPDGQVWINKNGTILLRPADNPTPELTETPTATPSTPSAPAIKPTTPAAPVTTPTPSVPKANTPAKPKSNISVIGNLYNGKKAPTGQVWVNKDGTILLRPSNNPTPELN